MAITTVRVTYPSGKPAKGYRVSLTFTSLTGGVTGNFLTDADGYAYVEHSSTGSANIIVQGVTKEHGVHCPGSYHVQVD